MNDSPLTREPIRHSQIRRRGRSILAVAVGREKQFEPPPPTPPPAPVHRIRRLAHASGGDDAVAKSRSPSSRVAASTARRGAQRTPATRGVPRVRSARYGCEGAQAAQRRVPRRSRARARIGALRCVFRRLRCGTTGRATGVGARTGPRMTPSVPPQRTGTGRRARTLADGGMPACIGINEANVHDCARPAGRGPHRLGRRPPPPNPPGGWD